MCDDCYNNNNDTFCENINKYLYLKLYLLLYIIIIMCNLFILIMLFYKAI